MQSIIKDIFYGNNKNFENIKMPETYKQNFDKFVDLEEQFRETLNGEQKELLDKVENLHDLAELDSCEAYYIEGFKLGLLIGVECSQNSGD